MSIAESSSLLVIACGALAREIEWLRRNNDWQNVSVKCLDAELHNRPEKIPEKLDTVIAENHDQFDQIFVAYGDCGTGGGIDKVLARWNLERLPGAHCYAFYATEARFNALADAEPGTFYLTDFLVRHFRSTGRPRPEARSSSTAAARVFRSLPPGCLSCTAGR
jgi:hypothetical protein